MFLVLIIAGVGLTSILIVVWIKRHREQLALERHTITPKALHELLTSKRDILLLDVRQPLDLLIDLEIIPGATRLNPKEVLQNPMLIPKDRNAVVYCTCPGEETSRRVLNRALAMQLSSIKLLKGGLAGWKARGYPVVPFTESFHLDVRR